MSFSGSYLDLDDFTARASMPPEDVGALPPEFVNVCLQDGSSEINAVLRKRYATPFADPVPRCVLRWLTDIVTPRLYDRRGWNASDAQETAIRAQADRARAEMKEAANSKDGLYDLPTNEDADDATAITKGGPLSYVETSPYEWTDVQRQAVEQ